MTDIVELVREEIDELTEALEMVTVENGRLREALRKCLPIMRKAHDRIHCLPRTSDTDLAEAIDIALGVARAALGEKK